MSSAQDKLDEEAYKLQEDVSQAVLDLVIAKPTVDYANKKDMLITREYPGVPKVTDYSLIALAKECGWFLHPKQLDLLIWTNTADAYLPFLFGALSKKVDVTLNNLMLSYTEKAYNEGVYYMVNLLI